MIMTKDEIVADYKQAKQPMKQIGILAELNGVKRDKIVEILREAGVELPGNYNKKPKEKVAELDTQAAPPIQVRDVPTIYESALRTIEKLYELACIEPTDASSFMNQVRGVLTLVAEMEEQMKGVKS